MEWISVKDRLPEENVVVLIFDTHLAILDKHFNEKYKVKRNPGIRLGIMYSKEEGLRIEGSNGKCDITHWQLLPEPPKD